MHDNSENKEYEVVLPHGSQIVLTVFSICPTLELDNFVVLCWR